MTQQTDTRCSGQTREGKPCVTKTNLDEDGRCLRHALTADDSEIAAAVAELVELTDIPADIGDVPLADWVTKERLAGKFCWNPSDGWQAYMPKLGIWKRTHEKVMLGVVSTVHGQLAAKIVKASKGASEDARRAAATRAALLHKTKKAKDVLELLPKRLRVETDQFDANPDLLCCGNGVIDLQTGEKLEWSPGYYMRVRTAVKYDPKATHPDWDAVLEGVPADVRAWFQRRLGQGVTGHKSPDDRLIICKGGGENGKTTVFAGVRRALGELFVDVSHRCLLGDASQHPTEMMTFRGARLALLEETPEGRYLSVERLKSVIGTEMMMARYMRQDEVKWAPTHTMFLNTNYELGVTETDRGTWRRMLLLTFPFTFVAPGSALKAGQKPGDPGLRDRIVAGDGGRAEAVLAWLVAGAVGWYADDKQMGAVPARVQRDTDAWRGSSDVVVGFSGERLVFDKDSHLTAMALQNDLNDWLAERGQKEWSAKTMSSRFTTHELFSEHYVTTAVLRPVKGEKTCCPGHTKQAACYTGIRFRTADDDALDDLL